VSLLEESARVPLLLRVPGRGEGSTSASLVELLDLFPTVARLAGLPVPERLQGEDLTSLLDDATSSVRDAAFSANGKGFLLRTNRWAYIQYGEQAQQGRQLYDMHADPAQLTNLAEDPAHAEVVASFTERMAAKLAAVRASDLGS
jgi:iduronate 2-sulfatase